MNETFMKEKPILPLLTSMALPMVISMMVNALYNIVDSLFVARINENAMTALSLVFPIQNFVNALAIGFGVGINALIAYFLGAGDKKGADRAATQGLVLALIHGVVVTVLSISIMPAFLDMFTNDVQVYQMGMEYAVIVFAFSTITMANLSFEKIFQSVGPAPDFRHRNFPEAWYRRRSDCHSDRSAVYPPSLPDGVQQAPDPGQNPQRIPCFS